jgi:hypothetical protein
MVGLEQKRAKEISYQTCREVQVTREEKFSEAQGKLVKHVYEADF